MSQTPQSSHDKVLRRLKNGGGSYWRSGSNVLSFVAVIIGAAAIAVVLILFVFQSFQVDGPSMQNTLHNNDRLIVWKAPVTWGKITGHPYIPSRGSIIVFKESGLADYGQQNTKDLIKRVVGLPGDRIVFKNGKVTIYNKQHPHGFSTPDNFDGKKGHPFTTPSTKNSFTLGKDQLFVMGDNRPNSLDSRYFGPINADQIAGKLVLRIYPLSDAEAF